MAAKPLSTERINYLRCWSLTAMIGTDVVKEYFDRVHPPADLETNLVNAKDPLELLKSKGKIGYEMWGKMYPRPGASPTSAEFDITLMVCLLREMAPKEPAPRLGVDKLPHKNDTSAGACLAIIKRYRNFLTHPDQVKLKSLCSTKFNEIFDRVAEAIQVLGKNQFSSEITAVKNMNIDNDYAEILETIVNYEKRFNDLQKEVDKISSQEKETKQLQEKFEEIEIVQTEEKISLHQLHDQMSEIRDQIKLQKEAFEKKVKEQKQLAATQIKHGKQIQNLDQETGSMKKNQEDQRKDTKELTEKHNAITSRTEELEKKANESTEKTNKLEEIQTMQHESIQTIEQEQVEQRKEVKEWKENQQSMLISSEPKIEIKEGAIQIKKPGLFGNSFTTINIPSAHHIQIGDNNTMNINSSSSGGMRTCDISPPPKPAKVDKEIVRQVLDSESTEAANELSGDGSDPGVS